MGFETYEYDEEQAQIAEEKKSNADAGGVGIADELASATVGLNVTPTGVTPKRSTGNPLTRKSEGGKRDEISDKKVSQ